MATKSDKPVIRVVELSAQELTDLMSDRPFKAPTDECPFIRAQKIVISYCTYYDMDEGDCTLDEAYQSARLTALPIAAIAEGIRPPQADLHSCGYSIWDALGSWRNPEDREVGVIAKFFECYACKQGRYSQIKV